MGKRLLLGIDLHCSLPAITALRSIGDLFDLATQELHVILITVVPVTAIPLAPDTAMSAAEGLGLPHLIETVIREEQREAEVALERASRLLEEMGIAPARIERVQRIGQPADEMMKVARELCVDCIVIGSRGNAFRQRLRRLFRGSTSRSIVARATCPVMVVTTPQGRDPDNLVGWYEAAIRYHLREHAESLANLTASEAAQMFVPLQTSSVGRREIAAASRALKRLARERLLVSREVQEEMK